jgi:hypothetical protein
MSLEKDIPAHVVHLMKSVTLAEFATVSSAGVPIDTVSGVMPSEGLKHFDFATGLAYPAKAERARKNPKTGLLFEGRPDEPVISVAGMAAVRDADLQASSEQYIREFSQTCPGNPDWALARKAVWYWTRMVIEVAPARVLWWENHAAMDGPPQRWAAPANTVYPKSDPLSQGKSSAAPKWPQSMSWQELADRGLKRGLPVHLTVLDGEGYPLPIRAWKVEHTETAFKIAVPKGLPWRLAGKATLSFNGIETFVGDVTGENGAYTLNVERALPILPVVADLTQIWEPKDDTREELMVRLRHELERRGQPIPTMPMEKPPAGEHYLMRMERRKALGSGAPGSVVPRK